MSNAVVNRRFWGAGLAGIALFFAPEKPDDFDVTGHTFRKIPIRASDSIISAVFTGFTGRSGYNLHLEKDFADVVRDSTPDLRRMWDKRCGIVDYF